MTGMRPSAPHVEPAFAQERADFSGTQQVEITRQRVLQARRAQAKLLNIGLPAFRQTFSTPNGERTRLRVGPYPTLAEAQKTAAQIRRLGFEAVPFRQRGG